MLGYGDVARTDPQENFQFIKHGVKMTGMPAFGPTKTDEQVWSLVAFLNVLPGISAADFEAAIGAPAASAVGTPDASAPVQPAQTGG